MASAAEQLAANLNFGAFQRASELQKRLWFTLGALIVYRIGTYIPIPGVDPAAFQQAFQGQAEGILGMFNMFSGGAQRRLLVRPPSPRGGARRAGGESSSLPLRVNPAGVIPPIFASSLLLL